MPDGVAHRDAFLGHVGMGVRAAETHLIVRLLRARREPERMLERAIVAEYRMLGLQALVDRRRAQRPRRGSSSFGKADAEAARIILAHLRVGVGERGPVAVPRDVHAPDIVPGIAIDHPLRERKADAAALAESGHDPAGDPEVARPANGPDQRIAVGGEGEGAVHHFADARLLECREMLEADGEARGDAVEIVGQQVLSEVPRRLALATTAGRPARRCRSACRRASWRM